MIVRLARLPDDAPAILAIDTGFTTGAVFDVELAARAMQLVPRQLPSPLRKAFPLDDLSDPQRPWSHAFVAEDGGGVMGFAAAGLEPWNQRLVLWHLYVDTPARSRGVGRALVNRIADLGLELGARHIWLETSNLNAPGVAAYEALGFTLTGADATLYDGTPAEGEVALFFSMPSR